MSEPPDAPLGDKLDTLFSRIVAALEREPGMRGGAAPGDPAPEPDLAPEPETQPGLNSGAKPPDGAERDKPKSRKPNPKPSRSAPSPKPDKAAMRAALDVLFRPDALVELRVIPKDKGNGVTSGYFDSEHWEALVNIAASLNEGSAAVYVTLNPVKPEVAAQCLNRAERRAMATGDKDILRRCLVLIDIDAVRQRGTSATAAQLEEAKEVARAVYQYLKAQGFPPPITCESGNGYHLLYRVNLPNDDESTRLIRGFLAGLAARFDTATVKVDQSVYNAARITKLYGTVANKGAHTPHTPWRQSRVVWGTDWDRVVTAEQLMALHPTGNSEASRGKARPARDYSAGTWYEGKGFKGFDVPRLLADLDLSWKEEPYQGGIIYKLDACPFNRKHVLGEAAVIVRADGTICFHCFHDGCTGKGWQDVRALRDGPREARHGTHRSSANAPPGGEGNGAAPGQSAGTTAGTTNTPSFLTAAVLWGMQHDPTRWTVPGALPEGVTLFCGKPKTGKSWLALDVSIAVGTGGRALRAIEVEPGPVLYLALEDTKRRLTKRLRILCGDITPPPQQIEFLTDCPRLGSGGEEVLRAWLRDHPTARLVVIDTLPRFRPPTNAKETPYANDYAVGEYLSHLCVEFQVSILLLGHLRKQPGDDPIDEISGTLGLVGSVDGYMVLRRQAMSDEATLYVCGRDVDDPAEHCIAWDRASAHWTITGGDPRVSRLPAEQRRVYELLSKAPKTIRELTETLNPGHVVTDLSSDQKYKNTAKLVYKLRDRDLVFQRPFDKKWWAPSTGKREGTGRTRGTQDRKCSPCSPLFSFCQYARGGTRIKQ